MGGAGGIGALIGGIGGIVGGIFSSSARRRAQRRFRRQQQEGIADARRITEERVQAVLDNPLIQSASNFIQESFAGDGGPLAEQFRKRLEVAQESRGLRRSTAGAVAEASSLAAFRQNFLAQLLPQAQSFGTLGERFRQSILGQELPINIASHTGAPIPGISQASAELQNPAAFDGLASAFSGGVSGALGGGQIGQQLGASQQQLQQVSAQNDFLDALRTRGGGGVQSFGGFQSSGGVVTNSPISISSF